MSGTRVYLAGPITGLTFEEATGWREEVTDVLTSLGYEVFNPLRGEIELARSHAETPIEATTKAGRASVFKRDTFDVRRSDIIVADLTGIGMRSVGTLFELGYAHAMGKMIIALVDKPPKGKKYHPFISGCAASVLHSLDDLYTLMSELRPVGAAEIGRVKWVEEGVSTEGWAESVTAPFVDARGVVR